MLPQTRNSLEITFDLMNSFIKNVNLQIQKKRMNNSDLLNLS